MTLLVKKYTKTIIRIMCFLVGKFIFNLSKLKIPLIPMIISHAIPCTSLKVKLFLDIATL